MCVKHCVWCNWLSEISDWKWFQTWINNVVISILWTVNLILSGCLFVVRVLYLLNFTFASKQQILFLINKVILKNKKKETENCLRSLHINIRYVYIWIFLSVLYDCLCVRKDFYKRKDDCICKTFSHISISFLFAILLLRFSYEYHSDVLASLLLPFNFKFNLNRFAYFT